MSTRDLCPAHSDDGLHQAVRQNRVNLGYTPQACTCDPDPAAELDALRQRIKALADNPTGERVAWVTTTRRGVAPTVDAADVLALLIPAPAEPT